MPIYILEHLEPKLYRWCLMEYRHISQQVGRENLWFTNVKIKNKELEKYGKVLQESAAELDLKKACLLDPEAEKTLTPAEAKDFHYFIFGGILGDYPPQKRTRKELTEKFPPRLEVRNIGKEQMSTDNAVAVVQEIVEGKKLESLPFQDEIEIPVKESESILLPYRYLMIKGMPLVSKELIDYLKKKKSF